MTPRGFHNMRTSNCLVRLHEASARLCSFSLLLQKTDLFEPFYGRISRRVFNAMIQTAVLIHGRSMFVLPLSDHVLFHTTLCVKTRKTDPLTKCAWTVMAGGLFCYFQLEYDSAFIVLMAELSKWCTSVLVDGLKRHLFYKMLKRYSSNQIFNVQKSQCTQVVLF